MNELLTNPTELQIFMYFLGLAVFGTAAMLHIGPDELTEYAFVGLIAIFWPVFLACMLMLVPFTVVGWVFATIKRLVDHISEY